MAEKRIASLDGLRAISVSLVLLYHIGQNASFSWSSVLRAIADNGWFGVHIFFVISGFLITWLLLVEEEQAGRFSISAFYGRRALRVLPPAFFYLLFVACLTFVGLAQVSKLDFLASALFFRHLLVHGGSTETGHFWTLSIEEQFYLIWPFVMVLCKNNKIRLWLLTALIVFAPVWRHLRLVMAGNADLVNYRALDMSYDALVIGCILALLRFDPKSLAFLRKPILQNPLTVFGLTVLLISDIVLPIPQSLRFTSLGLRSICVALIMSYLIDKPGGITGRILDLGPIVWIGTLSYSLYIWNQFFLKLSDYPSHPFWIRHFPQNLVATLFCSCVSFYLLEKPFSRMRRVLFKPPERKPVTQAYDENPAATLSL